MTEYDETKVERTDMYCHECSKNFVAELDYNIDGKHVVECPHCGHEHCRTINAGIITSDRWDGRNDGDNVVKVRNVWKHDVLKIKTSSACHFMREKWLNFGK